MNYRDDFKKWIDTVEEALTKDMSIVEKVSNNECNCGEYDCQKCYPEVVEDVLLRPNPEGDEAIGRAGLKDVNSNTYKNTPHPDETDVTNIQSEDEFEEDNGAVEMQQQNSLHGSITPDVVLGGGEQVLGHVVHKFVPEDDESEMEEATASNDSHKPKPTKTDVDSNEFDFGDILGGDNNDYPIEPVNSEPEISDDDGEFNDTLPEPPANPMRQLRDAPAGSIRTPAEVMRNIMNNAHGLNYRANADDLARDDLAAGYNSRVDNMGGVDPDTPLALRPEPTNPLVVRTASDVPAVISRAMRVTGHETPAWHKMTDVPQYSNPHIRDMGRKMFSVFTRTPFEQIKTISTPAGDSATDIQYIVDWLQNNADDLGPSKVDHGGALAPRIVNGEREEYNPDINEYTANGIRFQHVKDFGGEYIYAYPEKDANKFTSRPDIEYENEHRYVVPPRQIRGNMPRLRESLYASLKWEETLKNSISSLLESEAEMDESTTSKALGGSKSSLGAKKLIELMHKHHKLDNDAIFVDTPFTEQSFWELFKSDPNQFMIIKAENGVAAIKPSLKDFLHYIEQNKKIRAKEIEDGKPESPHPPGRNAYISYTAVAFMNDGTKIPRGVLMTKEPQPARADLGMPDKTLPPDDFRIHGGEATRKDAWYAPMFDRLKDAMGNLESILTTKGYKGKSKYAQDKEIPDPNAEQPPEQPPEQKEPLYKSGSGAKILISKMYKNLEFSRELPLEEEPFNNKVFADKVNSDPNKFCVIKAENGAAAIRRNADKKYTIVAYTNDGERVRPVDKDIYSRIKSSIGEFKTIVSQSAPPDDGEMYKPAINKGKQAARNDLGVGPNRPGKPTPRHPIADLKKMVFNRLRPIIIDTMITKPGGPVKADNIVLNMTNKLRDLVAKNNTAAVKLKVEKYNNAAKQMDALKVALNTNNEIPITGVVDNILTTALEKASGARRYSPEFKSYLESIVRPGSSSVELTEIVRELKRTMLGVYEI